MKEKIIKFLLDNANPSTVLRIKKEILNNLTQGEEAELLNKILPEKIVQLIIQSQKPDGWFGNAFHGNYTGGKYYDNMEVGLRYLVEKGFPHDNEYISKAINCFLQKEPFDSAYTVKEPKTPDTDYSYTSFGLYLYRSSVILRAGYEYLLPEGHFIDLKYDVDFSLANFANVLNYEKSEEVVETHRKKASFKQGVLWPCMYHLRMLAHSQSWRSEQNRTLLAESINHLSTFSQSGVDVYTYKRGQFISPCWSFLFTSITGGSIQDEIVRPSWFDIMELYARCGIVNHVPVLKNEYETMLTLIDGDLNLNFKSCKKRNSFYWGPYGGIALETDWRSKLKAQCDLMFRILLIIHYANFC
ncbi:MAG: hypothetical protein FWB80_07965 [Defluviitaleaceae bacterium]|nr:hypothetical protein [Defluviitaleaceae bacterium]